LLTAAAAPDRPPLVPTRDAAVTYRILSDTPGKERQLLVNEKAATGMVRFEMQGEGGYALMDLRTGRVRLVIPAQHAILELPASATPGPRQFLLDPGMKFARQGQDTVAGHACTVWDVAGPEGKGTLCMTDDGVMLSAAGSSGSVGVKGGLAAVSVSFLPQPDSLFVIPADYHRADMAKLLQSLQGKPPAP
jgi:hypothetical protein